MPRRNTSSRRKHNPKSANAALNLRQRGVRAWQAGHIDDAIAIWSLVVEQDQQLVPALAEAHFRRGLTRPAGTEQLSDLQRAVVLRPDDIRFHYHLGLALHRVGDLARAIAQYRSVLDKN